MEGGGKSLWPDGDSQQGLSSWELEFCDLLEEEEF